MNHLVQAILAELDDDALDQLAEKLAPRLAQRIAPAPVEDGWMNAREAAEYLGISVASLHKVTASRVIPFEQDAPGCKVWCKRSKLDAWRESGGKLANHF